MVLVQSASERERNCISVSISTKRLPCPTSHVKFVETPKTNNIYNNISMQ